MEVKSSDIQATNRRTFIRNSLLLCTTPLLGCDTNKPIQNKAKRRVAEAISQQDKNSSVKTVADDFVTKEFLDPVNTKMSAAVKASKDGSFKPEFLLETVAESANKTLQSLMDNFPVGKNLDRKTSTFNREVQKHALSKILETSSLALSQGNFSSSNFHEHGYISNRPLIASIQQGKASLETIKPGKARELYHKIESSTKLNKDSQFIPESVKEFLTNDLSLDISQSVDLKVINAPYNSTGGYFNPKNQIIVFNKGALSRATELNSSKQEFKEGIYSNEYLHAMMYKNFPMIMQARNKNKDLVINDKIDGIKVKFAMDGEEFLSNVAQIIAMENPIIGFALSHNPKYELSRALITNSLIDAFNETAAQAKVTREDIYAIKSADDLDQLIQRAYGDKKSKVFIDSLTKALKKRAVKIIELIRKNLAAPNKRFA